MSIQLTCPSGHTLTVSESWAGRAGRCPVCKVLVEVPACANVESRMLVPTMNGKAVTIDSRSLSYSETSPKSAPSNAAAASAPTHKSAPPALSAQITRTLSVTPSDRVTAPITVATQQASVSTPPPISVPPPLPLNVKLFGSPPPLPTSQALKTDRAHQEAVDRMVLEIGQAPPLLPNRIAPEARTETVRATVAPESEIAGKGAANQGATLPVSLSNAATSRPCAGYQPDADKLRGVYSLAVAMALFGFFCMVPALRHWNLGSAPNWASGVAHIAFAVGFCGLGGFNSRLGNAPIGDDLLHNRCGHVRPNHDHRTHHPIGKRLTARSYRRAARGGSVVLWCDSARIFVGILLWTRLLGAGERCLSFCMPEREQSHAIAAGELSAREQRD